MTSCLFTRLRFHFWGWFVWFDHWLGSPLFPSLIKKCIFQLQHRDSIILNFISFTFSHWKATIFHGNLVFLLENLLDEFWKLICYIKYFWNWPILYALATCVSFSPTFLSSLYVLHMLLSAVEWMYQGNVMPCPYRCLRTANKLQAMISHFCNFHSQMVLVRTLGCHILWKHSQFSCYTFCYIVVQVSTFLWLYILYFCMDMSCQFKSITDFGIQFYYHETWFKTAFLKVTAVHIFSQTNHELFLI